MVSYTIIHFYSVLKNRAVALRKYGNRRKNHFNPVQIMKKFLVFLLVATVASMSFDAHAQFSKYKKSKIDFSLLIGWDGLGDSPFSGLQQMDNAYGTQLWFNSWQLELSYNIVQTSKVKFFFGVGYQSDVFSMYNDYVYLATQASDGTPLDVAQMCVADQAIYDAYNMDYYGWETRLVTRYITIPIGISYDFTNDFGIGLTLLPGFNFSSRSTGMKYSHYGDDVRSMHDGLGGFIEAYKCDMRVNINFDFFSIFFQPSLLPVFKNTDRDDIYPIRFGFMVKM